MENVKRYLEAEGLLSSFFSRFNYCIPYCIAPPGRARIPTPACCRKPYYKEYDTDHPAFELLRHQREKRYGRPEDFFYTKRISPCEYHTLHGCRLKTHKSPVCLSFMCRESISFLRESYRIFGYDYLGVYYALEWILTGTFTEEQFTAFKNTCIHMLEGLE
ncbi:MAG: hypothetical protein R6U50_07020 [Desulfobacterales bacterium]